MKRSRVFAHVAFFTTICTALFAVTSASGQVAGSHLLTPNGNPTGAPSATSPPQPDGFIYSVHLNPSQIGTAFELPPVTEDTQPLSLYQILNNTLGAAGLNWRATGSFNIEGSLRLDNYFAWV